MADERASFDEALGQLLGVPLDQFTARRQELARRLSDAGDRDGAARILKVRKPSVTMWTANQVALYDPEAADLMLGAAAELARRQELVLRGGRVEAAEMRSASAAFQQALDRLVQRAARMPQAKAQSEASRRDLRDLLAAVAAGPDAGRVQLRAGRLQEQPEPIGFGGAGFGSTEPLPVGDKPAGRAAPEVKAAARARAQADKRAAEFAALRDRAHRADEAAKQAEAYAERLEAEAGRAEADAQRLRKEAGAARRRADQKRLEARRAAELSG